MIEQTGVEVIWYAHFVSSGVSRTGLSPTLTIYKNDVATPEVDAAAMTELADGFYYYKQTPATEGFRVAVAKTTDVSVDQRHVPAILMIGKAGVEHLDANVSSRSSHDDPDPNGYLDAAVSSRAAESSITTVKGAGWSAASDTLEKIREAVSNVPAQRQTQEI
jgi:hypothetical protein